MAVTLLAPETVKCIGQGDSAAMEAVDHTYRRQLTVFAWRRLRDWQTAEDVVQEVLFRLWRQAATIRNGYALNAWLYRATLNACIDVLRSRRSDLPWAKKTEVEQAPGPDPIERVHQRARIAEALDRLSNRQRSSVLMTVDGYLGREIAQRFGVTHQVVRRYLWEARQKQRGESA